jgi:DNA-binding MurR/RpiR family transcriptional regulator
MVDPPLAAELKVQFDALPPRLQEAARWIIDHPVDVAVLTLREQARRSGLAPATLTRLAQRFGMTGYDDLRRHYAEVVRQRAESFRGRAEELLQRRKAEGDAVLVQDIFAAITRHLAALADPARLPQLTEAAERIAAARRVYCLGLRASFSVAYIFHYVRSLFGSVSVLLDSPGGAGIDMLRTIGEEDVLLVISVKPYTRQTVQAARYASERGAGVVAVTDSAMSPLAGIADEALLVQTDTPSFFHTMAPAFAAIECLAALVAARRGDDTLAALAASEEQLAAFDTYVQPVKRRSRS